MLRLYSLQSLLHKVQNFRYRNTVHKFDKFTLDNMSSRLSSISKERVESQLSLDTQSVMQAPTVEKRSTGEIKIKFETVQL